MEISTSAPTDPNDLVTALAKGSKSPIECGSASCASSRDTGSTSIAFCASIDLGDSGKSLVVLLFHVGQEQSMFLFLLNLCATVAESEVTYT